MSSLPHRAVDPGTPLRAFADRCLVVCPRCGQRAEVVALPPGGWPEVVRVTCSGCGFHRVLEERRVAHRPVQIGDGWHRTAEGWMGPVAGYAAYGRCPRCGAGLGEPVAGARPGVPRPATRQIACRSCRHEVTVQVMWVAACPPEPSDPHVGLPLWLCEPCCGETLWAYNEAHVAALEAYVGADLRERAPNRSRSMRARLPRWMTAAKHRPAVLAGLERLRARALAAAGAGRT